MITLKTEPKNKEKYRRLLAFLKRILPTFNVLKSAPILDGSLAVLAYTGNESLDVNDIDFSLDETEFPKLRKALVAVGVDAEIKEWHVLQVRDGDLKIEFSDINYWYKPISDSIRKSDKLEVENIHLDIVQPQVLSSMYKVGIDNTENDPDKVEKRRDLQKKYELLTKLD